LSKKVKNSLAEVAKLQDTEIRTLWQSVLMAIKNQVNEATFAMFRNAKPVLKNNKFEIIVINKFSKDYVEKHLNIVSAVINSILGKNLQIEIKVEEESQIKEEINKQIEDKFSEVPDLLKLKPKYTFENFVVGKSNEFAHAAAKAVANAPGKVYNPLYIYGGVGLGKTHLMQAIGHFVMSKWPNKKVVYSTSEEFTSDFIKALGGGKKDMDDFKNRYRKIDVLLIDDVQFLAGKESTQEEFFHTFNELFQYNKQIVLTSDRAPKDIEKLPDRLISRFESGLIADILEPDLELRVAILLKEAQDTGVDLSYEIATYLASKIESNIRQLEGAYLRVLAMSSLRKKTIDKEMIDEALKDFVKVEVKRITIDTIKEVIAEEFGISLADMDSKRRSDKIAFPRQIAMYLACELMDMTLAAIGESFGGRDHSTIIHAQKKISAKMEADPEFKERIEFLKRQIKLK